MRSRILGRWTAVLYFLIAFGVAHAQDLPLLEPSATFSSAGCYPFLPRCFVFAEAIQGDTAITSTTAPAIGVHARAADEWAALQAVENPDYPAPPNQYSPQRRFGFPVAFGGDSLLVGGTSAKFNFKDVVYAFARIEGAWKHVRTLLPPRPQDYYATVVTDIAVSGNTAAVCGVRYRSGTEVGAFAQIDIYKRDSSGQWIRRSAVVPPTSASDSYAHVIALEGNTLLVANPSADQSTGRAFIYENTAAGWKLRKTLTPPTAQLGAAFGESIAIDGNTIAIAARGFVAPNTNRTGAAFVFERISSVWQRTQQITAPADTSEEEIAPDARFATAVHLAGDRLLIDFDSYEQGKPFAFLYERRDLWRRVAGLSNVNEASHTAALDGTTALVNVNTGFSTQGYSVELPALGSLPAE